MGSRKFAVFIDIDETLMSNGVVPKRNIDAIARIRELGHKVFLNTGRSYACIPGQILKEIRFDGVVAGIGADVRCGNEILRSVTFTEEQLRKLFGYYLTTDKLCHVEGEAKMFYINPRNPQDKIIIRKSDEFFTLYPDSRISKFTVVGKMSPEEEKLLEEDFVFWRYDNYYEFALKGCSKAVGMKMILDRLSWGRRDCIAIGDSKNDIDMLKFAGISIAMGNSPDEIREMCDDVTDSAEEAGVAAEKGRRRHFRIISASSPHHIP